MSVISTLRQAAVSLVLIFIPVRAVWASSDTLLVRYQSAFNTIVNLADANERGDFKKAVYTVENTYWGNSIDQNKFNDIITRMATICNAWVKANKVPYSFEDSANFSANLSIFKILKDTIKLSVDGSAFTLLPFEYDFDDYAGKDDWSKMFVTKLLNTHSGNCHSLPFLYNILADELNAKCWLALAPGHIYIRNYSKKDGWYNTELTTGDFPVDAWLTASGYISLQALQSGLYCDTLSNQESIALCLLDLAKCYERQTKNYYDGFIIQCCEKVLAYHPLNAVAMLLKAETTKQIYERQKLEKNKLADSSYVSMEKQYLLLYNLGYREMPNEMYREWLASIIKQKDKYLNKNMLK